MLVLRGQKNLKGENVKCLSLAIFSGWANICEQKCHGVKEVKGLTTLMDGRSASCKSAQSQCASQPFAF
jgi:hypothetical protein